MDTVTVRLINDSGTTVRTLQLQKLGLRSTLGLVRAQALMMHLDVEVDESTSHHDDAGLRERE